MYTSYTHREVTPASSLVWILWKNLSQQKENGEDICMSGGKKGGGDAEISAKV